MSTLFKDNFIYIYRGFVFYIHDDDLDEILRDLQPTEAKKPPIRLSHVEWDESRAEWVARTRVDGEEIAAHPRRGVVLKMEVNYFENLIEKDPEAFLKRFTSAYGTTRTES